VTASKGSPESPGFVAILLTLLAAVVVVSVQGPSILDRWKYPVHSLRDPPRALFMLGEYEGHVAVATFGKDRAGPGSELEDLQLLGAELRQMEHEYGSEFIAERLNDLAWAMAVLAAGYGSPDVMATLDTIPGDGPPVYVQQRLRELRAGDGEPDLARAKRAFRWDSRLRIVGWSMIIAGFLGAGMLWRWRAELRGSTSKPPGLQLARALFVFVWTQAGIAGLLWLFPATIDAADDILGALLPTVFAVTGFLLVDGVSGTWRSSPLAATLRLPSTSLDRRQLAAVAFAGLGACAAFWQVAQRVLYHFDLQSRASDGLNESVLYGSAEAAIVAAAVSVIIVPLGEELVFRGVLFGGLATRMSVHRAALLSAVVFSLWHGAGLARTLSLTVTGYVLARAYQRTGSLLPSIAIHATNNAASLLWDLALRP
jgi:membrane protease YdiL (CAAX protease family)